MSFNKITTKSKIIVDMCDIITRTLQSRSYENFCSGALFVDQNLLVGWSGPSESGEVFSSSNRSGLNCAISVKEALENEDCQLWSSVLEFLAGELSDDDEYAEPYDDIVEFNLRNFCQEIVKIFDQQSATFNRIPFF